MPGQIQNFFATSIPKALKDLEEAVERLPEDKRSWSPMGDSRTALDQASEIALLNESISRIIQTLAWPADYDLQGFSSTKAELAAKGWDAVKTALEENTAKVVRAIEETNEEDLSKEVQMPWGPMTLEQITSYPYWNTTYHEGQINYIASMLGCLK